VPQSNVDVKLSALFDVISTEAFTKQADLSVPGLGWPTDMVAVPSMNCIYVSDRYGVKVTHNEPDKPGIFSITDTGNPVHHLLDVTPAGLSITSDKHLLAVCEDEKRGRSLRFFRSERSSDGVELVEVEDRRIELELERYVLQATEVREGRYVISQVHKSRGVHRIVVVNNSGAEVR